MAKPAPNREARIAEQRQIEKIAVESRIKGLAWDEITQILAKEHKIVCSQIKAQNLCDRALSRTSAVNANHLRALESRRFDIIVRDFLAICLDKNTAFHERYKAATVLLRVSTQRCTMLGLNMQPVFMTPTTQAADTVAQNLSSLISEIKSQSDDPEPPQIHSAETWHDRRSQL